MVLLRDSLTRPTIPHIASGVQSKPGHSILYVKWLDPALKIKLFWNLSFFN